MSQELIPYSDIEKMGTAVAESGLFGVKTVKQAVALMLVAQAYGKHPAQAAMEYNIINNRPAKKAEAMLASFQEAGGKVKWIELTDKRAEAEFSHPSGGTLTLAWTFEMAKNAGLVDKEYSNYKKYPRAMLRSRVVAEGVRAVYPAATGGMLSKEEAEDIVDDKIDVNKSRVEQIVDSQVEEADIVKEEVKQHAKEPIKEEPKQKAEEKQPEKQKKTTKKEDSKPDNKPADRQSDPSIKTVIGLIDNTVQGPNGEIVCVLISKEPVNNPNTGIAAIKYSFLIGDQRFGTWDANLAKQVMECIDNRILVKFEYKERPDTKTAGKVFNDIISFKCATAEDVKV